MLSTKGLVDFHCHLDLYPDHAAAVKQTEEAGIYTLSVTTTPRAWPQNLELTRDLKYVRAALGLHPQLISENLNEIEIWEKYLHETRFVGEVGLDAGPRFYKNFGLQKEVFKHVLLCCSKQRDKVLTIHSVRSAKTVLDYIEAYLPENRGKVVLHWFTGSKSEAKRAIEMGCFFSINESMLVSGRHKPLVSSIPIDRVLTETDGPFTKTNNCPSQPADVVRVVNELARIYRLHPNELAIKIRNNLKRVIK